MTEQHVRPLTCTITPDPCCTGLHGITETVGSVGSVGCSRPAGDYGCKVSPCPRIIHLATRFTTDSKVGGRHGVGFAFFVYCRHGEPLTSTALMDSSL